jgi:ketosteroid isomerase-like protein
MPLGPGVATRSATAGEAKSRGPGGQEDPAGLHHAFARRQVRELFARLGSGDYEYVLSRMARPRFGHSFAGDRPLGGTRHTLPAKRARFERFHRLEPDVGSDIRSISVGGGPWDTRIAVEWIDRATLADGHPCENRGVHLIRLRRRRAVSAHAHLATQIYAAACRRTAENGVAEAEAAPVEE